MINLQNELSRQEVLTSVKLQFSGPLRRLRDISLDQIFIGILATAEQPLSVEALRLRYSDVTFGGVIVEQQVYAVLTRLRTEKKVSQSNPESLEDVRYQLSSQSVAKWQIDNDAHDTKVDSIASKLFKSPNEDYKKYIPTFLDVLSEIAAELSGESAAYLLRNGEAHSLSTDAVQLIVNRNLAQHPELDDRRFRHGLQRFFTEPDPDYNLLLWHFTESYFMARMLGLDNSGQALSKRLFDTWEFILDANFVIPLFFESDPMHFLVSTVFRAIRNLNRPMEMLQQTLDEVQAFLEHELSLLERYVAMGKGDWLGRTDSAVLRQFSSLENADFETFAESIRAIPESLATKYGIKIRDDFRVTDDRLREDFARDLIQRYRRPNRSKGYTAALHDSDLIIYVAERRKSVSHQSWVLTCDSSLPGAFPPNHDGGSIAIVARDLIHWLAPVSEANLDEGTVANSFSQLVRERLFPSSRLFDPGDLATVLEELNETNALVDEEVEVLLGKVSANFINIDPTTPEGRENLDGLIRSSTLNPDSAKNQHIKELKAKVKSTERLLKADHEAELAEERQRGLERASDFQHMLEEKEKELELARAENERWQDGSRERTAIKKFWLVLTVSLVVSIVLIVLAIYVTANVLPTFPLLKYLPSWLLAGVFTSFGLGALIKAIAIRLFMGQDAFESLPDHYQNKFS